MLLVDNHCLDSWAAHREALEGVSAWNYVPLLFVALALGLVGGQIDLRGDASGAPGRLVLQDTTPLIFEMPRQLEVAVPPVRVGATSARGDAGGNRAEETGSATGTGRKESGGESASPFATQMEAAAARAALVPVGRALPATGSAYQAAQLGQMEFTLEARVALPRLVELTGAAFYDGAKLVDASGRPVDVAMYLVKPAGSLIVFFGVDGNLRVCLPRLVVDEILQRAAEKAGGRVPLRVNALFNAAGQLERVDVDV